MDLSGALELTCGDRQWLQEIAEVFEEECTAMLRDVKAAVDIGDANALFCAAHKLKGALANFCAGPSTRAALQLERSGRQGQLNGTPEALVVLIAEVTRLRCALGQIGEATRT